MGWRYVTLTINEIVSISNYSGKEYILILKE
jgi:hypothetical protein